LHREDEILPACFLDKSDGGFIGGSAGAICKQTYIGGKLFGHMAGNRVPMTLIKDEDSDHLYKDHWYQN